MLTMTDISAIVLDKIIFCVTNNCHY